MRTLRVVSLSVLLLAAWGGRRDTLWHPAEPCATTVCMNGAGGDRHPGNQVVNALCAELPGRIEDCADAPCSSTFASFDGARVEQAVTEVLAALADHETGACTLSVVGYSLGGVDAVAVAESLTAKGVAIDRFVLLDPYSPTGPDPLIVPDGVRAAWLYRHSVAPPDDCSANRPVVGPYEGFGMVCSEGTTCLDDDDSLDERYTDVDPCTVPAMALDAARGNVLTGAAVDDPALPRPE